MAHCTDVSVEVRFLSGEPLLQEKYSTGHRWDSNPCPTYAHSSLLKVIFELD